MRHRYLRGAESLNECLMPNARRAEITSCVGPKVHSRTKMPNVDGA